MKYEGYRILDEGYVAEHSYVLSVTYPEAELIAYQDHPEVGWLAWSLPVQTARGTVHELIMVYPYNYPEAEPRVFPSRSLPRNAHLYSDGSLCVHSASSWSRERGDWTPAVGFTNARLWLEMYEDHLEGRDWSSSSIPKDIRDRLR